MSERGRALDAVRAFCGNHPLALSYDAPSDALFDVAAGKSLPLRSHSLVGVEEASDRQTGAPYLRLVFGDGTALALTVAGIAFPPSFANTGPLLGLPEAVSLRDFATLQERLRHLIFGHGGEGAREALPVVMACLAVLDGARAVGFEVSEEERAVDALLRAVEERYPG